MTKTGANIAPRSAPPQVAAALLALTDIGDPSSLIAAATSVKNPNRTMAEALTYMFQRISPTLEPEQEIKPLVAALDSNCLMLRRYVIQRLGQLKDPTTVTALENRLAKEDKQLQPLITVSLDAIRGDTGIGDPEQPASKAKATIREWIKTANAAWAKLTKQQQYMILGGTCGLFLLSVMFLILRIRRRRRLAGEAWANMVNPSDEYLEDGGYGDEYGEGEYAEGEYAQEGEYEEYAEGEYVEGEFVEGEYVEGEDDEGEYVEMDANDDFADFTEEESYR